MFSGGRERDCGMKWVKLEQGFMVVYMLEINLNEIQIWHEFNFTAT